MIFTHMKLEAHGHKTLPEFAAAIRNIPEVVECYILLRETDYLLRIVTSNVKSHENFVRDHLSQLPAVRETSSSIVLSEIKSASAMPLSLV